MKNQNTQPTQPQQPVQAERTDELVAIKEKRTQLIATLGIMLATSFVAMIIDRTISIFLPVSFAIISLVICVAFALITNKWYMALYSGACFGVTAWVTAFIYGRTAFQNPLVGILPRLFVGIAAFGIYRLVLLIGKKSANVNNIIFIGCVFAGMACAITNTGLVLPALQLFAQGDPAFETFKIIIYTNFIPEVVCTAAIAPFIVPPVRRALKLNRFGDAAEAK